MKITSYSITTPYFINGHKNADGMAMADDLNKQISDQGLSDDKLAVESLLQGYASAETQELYHLEITSAEIEEDLE